MSTVLRLVGAAMVVAALSSVGVVPPASATITGVNPSGATVSPSQGAAATVSLRSGGSPPSCLTVSAPAGVSAAVDTPCGDGSWSSRLSVGTTSATAPGTYAITLTERDKTGTTTGSATFTLTVKGPDPTTTTARPTTTRPRQTTTTAEPATTTVPPVTDPPTTTTVPPPQELTLAEIADRPLPDRVLFLPFPGDGRRGCVPLDDPCVDPDFELVVIPAEGHELVWVPAPESAVASDVAQQTAVAAVGVEGATLASATFLVPALDARPAGGRVELLPRVGAVESGPVLTPGPTTSGSRLTATLRPPPPVPPEPLLAATLFDQPTTMPSSDLIDGRPAVVVFGAEPLVAIGIIADPGWRLDGSWLPLLKATGVVHLGRHPNGRVGLAVPTNIAPVSESSSVEIVPDSDGNSWALIAILGAGAAAVFGGVAYTRRRS